MPDREKGNTITDLIDSEATPLYDENLCHPASAGQVTRILQLAMRVYRYWFQSLETVKTPYFIIDHFV